MYRKYIKRCLDIFFSLLLFPFFVLLLLVVGPIIRFGDGGPIFYSAERIGLNGKLFRMFKFRSMIENAPDIRNSDGTTYNSEDDPRVTKVGKLLRKTSLDEIPQLINVLIGDMSWIGSRPDLPDALNVYSDFDRKKLIVRPGITGYSQAYYRNSADFSQKMKGDVFYAENVSFLLDVRILFKTVWTVLKGKNLYRN